MNNMPIDCVQCGKALRVGKGVDLFCSEKCAAEENTALKAESEQKKRVQEPGMLTAICAGLQDAGPRYKQEVILLVEGYRALQAENAELKEAQRWRSVADGELPEGRCDYFVYISRCADGPPDEWLRLAYFNGEMFLLEDQGDTIHLQKYMTHWMPLPQPPEGKQGLGGNIVTQKEIDQLLKNMGPGKVTD